MMNIWTLHAYLAGIMVLIDVHDYDEYLDATELHAYLAGIMVLINN